MLLTKKQITSNPEIYIKWKCLSVFISVDNQVFNLSLKPMKERLIGGSYCFFVDGRYRTTKFIRNNCMEVLGLIFND